MSGKIALREVTDDNLDKVIRLSHTLTESQKRCVASNERSVAQGSMSDLAWFRAVYLDEEPIGFIMVELYTDELPEEDQPAIYLWRFMIGRDWQGKGYGSQVLDLIVDRFQKQGIKTIYTSCEMHEADTPYPFYLKYGFIDTGKESEGEQILRFAMPEVQSKMTDEEIKARPWEYIYPKIALITIWTDQIDQMKAFYTKALGFFVKLDLGNYVEFEHPGVRFAICEREVMHAHSEEYSKTPQGQQFELAFPCDEPEEVDIGYQRLIQAGAGAIAAPQDMPWGQRTALFSDPDGNIHEIFAELEAKKE